MDEQGFSEAVERLERVNEVVVKLDPAIRSAAFAVLGGYLSGAGTGASSGQAAGSLSGDIDALVLTVMADTVSDAEADIRRMMNQMQSITAAKRQLRGLICKVMADIAANTKEEPEEALSFGSHGLGSEGNYHQAPLPAPDPDCAGGVQTIVTDLHPGPITRVEHLRMVRDALEAKLDGMSEMSELTSLRLQMMMDRRSKFISTLSNIMKKISTTQDTLVQNLK